MAALGLLQSLLEVFLRICVHVCLDSMLLCSGCLKGQMHILIVYIWLCLSVKVSSGVGLCAVLNLCVTMQEKVTNGAIKAVIEADILVEPPTRLAKEFAHLCFS